MSLSSQPPARQPVYLWPEAATASADMAESKTHSGRRFPVPPKPANARGIVGSLPQLRIGHGQQHVQIEWAGAAPAGCRVTRC